jgi:general secretion pathway protein L
MASMTVDDMIKSLPWLNWLSRQADEITASILLLITAIRPRTKIKLVEGSGGRASARIVSEGANEQNISNALQINNSGAFVAVDEGLAALTQNADVDIVLHSDRFISRQLELPNQASKFLDGVVRSQIDRLAPWPPSDVLFAYSAPKEIKDSRISVAVVTAARAMIEPIATSAAEMGAKSISISASMGDDLPPLFLLQHKVGSERYDHWVKNAVYTLPLASNLAAVLAVLSWLFFLPGMESRQAELTSRIGSLRSTLTDKKSSNANMAGAALVLKKNTTPAAVIVIDTLSKIIPDDTYLTELRIDDHKLEISGLTHDAASLIAILERSQQFTNASFNAPTTHSPSEAREHFDIEANIQPTFPSAR